MRILIAINQARVLYDFKRELVSALLAQGHEVYLSFEEDFRVEYFESTQAKIVPTPIDPRGVNPLRDYKLYRFYKRLLARLRPNVVLTFTIKPNVYCGKACQACRVPYMATISGLGAAVNAKGPLARVSTELYRVGLRGAKRVFCQNESIARIMVEGAFTSEGKIVRVSGSGVDLDHFSALDYPDEKDGIELLFIGRLMRDKGILEFIECAKAIRQKRADVKFRVLGAPERRCAEYGQVCAAAKEGVVEYLGYQLDVVPYLRTASAVVLPSYHEGLSNVLLEGAASCRPLLTTNVPGCVETLDDGVSGYTFEPRRADALTDAVERFLALSREEREKMGRLGREKVAKSFDRAQVVQAYLDEIAKER